MGAGTRMETRKNRPAQNKLRFFLFFLVDRGGVWLIPLVADERRRNPTRKSDIMKQENKPANEVFLAAITAKYIGATDRKGSRIKVTSQRGSKVFSYPHEYSRDEVFSHCVAMYLESVRDEDRKLSGYADHDGWGKISDYAMGVLPTGEHVFVSVR